MSFNHFCSEFPHHHQSPKCSALEHHPKQPMFEKPLTPSDVGKLNRLVIPKQYAEQYFPLSDPAAGVDSADKGLLLTFEDDSAKLWRFRYSYWNSSQSYVLTKGWSRFVKEKRLQAGDAVVFQRHLRHPDRFFITWKRRSPDTPQLANAGAGASAGGWTRMFSSSNPYHHPLPSPPESSVRSKTVSVGNSKILRLFGVDMECQTDVSEPEAPSMLGGGSGLTGRDPTHHSFYTHYSSPLPHHMDFPFPEEDMKKMKYER